MWRQVLAAAGVLFVLATGAAGQTALYSSWIGGPGADRFTGSAVLRDGTVVLGGTMPNEGDSDNDPKFVHPPKVTGRGDGVVIRVAPYGGEIKSVLRLPGAVNDLDCDDAGGVYLTGAFGSARLDIGGRVLWSSDVGGPTARISAGPAGSAILLAGKTVSVISPHGTVFKSWKVEADHVLDVSCDSPEQLAYVTGYDDKPGADGKPIQVAFVYAYDGAGQVRWKAYGWTAAEIEAAGVAGDTRGCVIKVGPDHKVYVAGESAGAKTIWSRKSQDLRQEAGQAKSDKFQDATGVSTGPITFLVRLDAATGKSEGGTFLLARQPDGKPGALRPRSLAVDADGRMYVGGAADASPPVSEASFGGSFDGGGGFFALFEPSFRRLYAAKLCSGPANTVSVGRGCIIVAGEGSENLTPLKPFQKEYGGGDSDGWVVLLSPPPVMLPVSMPVPSLGVPAVAPTAAIPAVTPSVAPVTTPTVAQPPPPPKIK